MEIRLLKEASKHGYKDRIPVYIYPYELKIPWI